MILVDAVYVNLGGGKVLLDYFVETCEKTNLGIFYLFDARCINSYKNIPDDRKLFLKSSIIKRHKFYLDNKNKLTKVLCFGNIPPTIKLNCPVITFFQNVVYARIPKESPSLMKIKLWTKKMVLKYNTKNSNKWIVQTNNVRDLLVEHFPVQKDDVYVFPFFPKIQKNNRNPQKGNISFIYPSNTSSYKNLKRLLDAWEILLKKGLSPSLTLTLKIPPESQLAQKINILKQKGVRINNLGVVPYSQLLDIYYQTDFLAFPSLMESFGLPMLEAIQCGCNVIASDLEFVNDIILPTATFNPFDPQSIADSVEALLSTNVLMKSKILIDDKVLEIIELLKT